MFNYFSISKRGTHARHMLTPLESPTLTPLKSPTLTPVTDERPDLLDIAFTSSGAKKQTRVLLRSRVVLVEWDPRCSDAAAILERLLDDAYAEDAARREPAPHMYSRTNETTTAEYFKFFHPCGYTIGGSELSAESASRIIALLDMSPSDRFVDLGAASGRLTLAAALLSPAASSLGVELSPSRSAEGSRAAAWLASAGHAAAGRTRWLQGDLLDAPLEGATVVWCAVRPTTGRKLAAALLANLRSSLAPGARARLLLPGFALPHADSAGATLTAGYVFEGRAAGTSVTQLYGDHEGGNNLGGPQVVLEYCVEAV